MSAVRNIKAIKPLLDRVLISRIKAGEKTASGIFIPEKAQEKLSEGVVLAVGPGALDKDGKRIGMEVKSGDKVLLPPYGGSAVKVGEEEYSLFKSSEILALIKE